MRQRTQNKLKTVTSWSTLMHYARALGEARRRGVPEEIAKAEAEHESYRQLCLASDEMMLPSTAGELSPR